MSMQPAPLYIIMLDHGNVEKFYINPEIIIPLDLDSWIDAFETKLPSYDFEKNPVFVFIGTCGSGGFINDLSKTGRVIITSASENESASRGPIDDDKIREGSYFLSEFFKAAARGKSIKKSFDDATRIIENWTCDKSKSNAQSTPFYDCALQHPLIDDNGDGKGSNVSSPVQGEDGASVIYKYLGAASAMEQLEITGVAPQISLGTEDSLPRLWIELNDPSRLDTLWLEIKVPDFSYPDVKGSDQIENNDFIRVPFNPQNLEGKKCYFDDYEECDFSQPGIYEVFYFVKDSVDKKILPPQKTIVNKEKPVNKPPESFNLVAPTDNSTLNDSPILFDWEPSMDPDGDAITYSLYVSDNKTFNNTAIIVNEIETSSVSLDIGSALQDGKTYYWKVEAVDIYGATTPSSQMWSFYKDFSNIVLGVLQGYVTAAGKPLSGVGITSNCSSNHSTSDKGVFFLVGPGGSYQGTASAVGYCSKDFGFTLVDGSMTYVEISMEKCIPTTTTTIEPCPADQAIHDKETLSLLKNFRDYFLRKTPERELYIKAYYAHTEELSKIIISSPLLKQQFVRLIEDTTPVIKSLINKEQTVISKKQKKEITAFLNKVHTKSSPDLKNIIQKIKTKLMGGELGP